MGRLSLAIRDGLRQDVAGLVWSLDNCRDIPSSGNIIGGFGSVNVELRMEIGPKNHKLGR